MPSFTFKCIVAPLDEIKGHNECHQVPDKAEGDLRLAVYARERFPFCRQGFGYYEYKEGSQLTKNKKSVRLEIEVCMDCALLQ